MTLGALAAVAFAYNRSSNTIDQQLQFRTVRVRAGKIKLKGNRLEVGIIISNPSSDSPVINSVVGEVYLNGRKLGNVENFTRTVVKPNDKTTLYLDVRVMLLQLLTELNDMANKKLKVELGLTGSMNINDRVVPMHFKYDVI